MENTNNIFIGPKSGYAFIKGKENIFIGDHAGEDVVESDRLLIIRMDNGDELRHTMTDKEYKFMQFILFAQIGVRPKENEMVEQFTNAYTIYDKEKLIEKVFGRFSQETNFVADEFTENKMATILKEEISK